jgi:hypothetical protein
MKKMLISIALCAVSFSGGAQTPLPDERVTVPGELHKIELPSRFYPMDNAQFDDYRGSYTLSNGQTLHLSSRGRSMYAEIDEQGDHRIVATGRNAFVALDRKLKMRIDWRDDGSVGGEVTMVVPRRVAGGPPVEEVVTMVMR